MGHLKSRLKEIGAGRAHAERDVQVLVELSLPHPDDTCIGQLQDAGLKIQEVIGNTVVGRIDSGSEGELERLPVVASVERSVHLERHQ